MMPPELPRRRSDPLLGVVLGGQYRIDAKIGEGGMGAVYRATQLTMRREVAIKVLRAQVGAEEKVQLIERFRREALATSRLRHPNTVSVYDFGEAEDGTLYMVLELLQGATFSRVLRDGAPLPPERVAYLGKQIAKSLAEAHEAGIVHRDLKPDNVFVCDFHGDADFVKVMDFGIARLLGGDDNAQVTRTGMMVGTPRYIAPEQAMGRQVTPAADLYSLGVILFEALCGHAPFDADSAVGLALAHVNEPIPTLVMPGYPDELTAGWRGLVTALLTKSPHKRPQSASDVAQWLSQLELDARRHQQRGQASNWTVEAAIPGREAPSTYEGPSPKPTVTVSRAVGEPLGSSSRIALAAVLLMVLGGGLAYALLAGDAPPAPIAATLSPEDAPGAGVVTRPAAAVANISPASAARTTPHPTAPAGPADPAGPTDPTDPATAARTTPHPADPTDPTGPATAAQTPPHATDPATAPTAATDPTTATAPPAPAPPAPAGPAHLVLASVPKGAAVSLGTHLLCTTPCDLDLDDERGVVELILRARGYVDHALVVELVAGETLEETVTLKRRPAPSGAAPVPPGSPSLPALRLDRP